MANVAIYTTPTCGYCEKAKEFFNEKGVQYEEFDVSSDQEKRAEMIEMTGQMGVPVINIEGHEPVTGFDQDTVEKMLETAGENKEEG
jgi:glutaredoxin-like YruB-family protein